MTQKKLSIFVLVLAGFFVGHGAYAHIVPVDTSPSQGASLRLGSRGEAVKDLQLHLSNIPGIYPEGLITGYFGTLTEKAVRKLQAENGLEQVGFVGPKTRELLNNLSKGSLSNTVSGSYVVPQVYVIESSSNSPTRGYIFWTTNRMTTSEFMYSNTSPVTNANSIKISNSSLNFTHSVNLSGLSTSTTYYYIIKVSDEKGNSATSTERSFMTISQ